RGIEYLKQALELDPGFARAWVEIGRAYSSQAALGWAPVSEGYERGRQAAERALTLESDLADGHCQLATIQMSFDRDWHGAETSLKRALDLAPGSAQVVRMAGHLAFYNGRLDSATELYRRASELDPLSANAYFNLGWALREQRRFSEAVDAH